MLKFDLVNKSFLLTNLDLFGRLLTKWINIKYSQEIDEDQLIEYLNSAYQNIQQDLERDYLATKWVNDTTFRYIAIRDSLEKLLGKGVIKQAEAQLTTLYQDYVKNTIHRQEFFKLARKQEVTKILNETLWHYNISFELEQDFIDLLSAVDRSTWFEDWNFLRQI